MPAKDGSIASSGSRPGSFPGAALRTEAYLRSILTHTPECIKVVAQDGTLLDMNDAGLRMVEADEPHQVVGKKVFEMVAPDFRQAFRAMHERVCAGEQGFLEFEIVGLKGTRRRIETTAVPLPNPGGHGHVHLSVARDITSQARVADALRQSRKLEEARRIELETLMEAVPAIVWVAHDPQCRRITGNRAGYEFLRLPAGSNISRTGPPEERPAEFQVFRNGRLLSDAELPMQQVGRTGQAIYGEELEERFSDGTTRWLYGNVVPLRNAEQAVCGVLATFLDITERRRAEEALRLSEERFRLAAFSEAITLYEQDANLRYTWLYPLHPEHEQSLGRSDLELLPDEQGETLARWKREVMSTGQPQRREVKTSLAAGARAYDVFMVPKRNSLGQIVGVAGTALDITRRKEAEQSLREMEERFRSILDNSPTVIFIKDPQGHYLQINRWHEQLFHIGQAEIVGKTDFDIFPAEIAQKFRDHDLAVLRTGRPLRVEEIAPHDDGPHTYISIKFPLRREDGTIYAITGISTDITERKRHELAAQRLAAIVEHSEDAIISKDLDGIITSWNRGAERLFGYTAEEAIGNPITILIPQDLAAQEAEILERVRSERIAHYETVRRRKDGMLVNISLTVSPIKDSSGKVIGASKVARDITDKVRAKEKLERTVAERTASLREAIAQMEEFSYSVSHDLRSPVRAMQGYARALGEDYGSKLDDTGREYLDRIIQGSARMERLIHEVLTYSRVSRMDMELQPVSLGALMEGLLRQYPEFDPSRADIVVQPDLPIVRAHEPSLGQAVANILSNAVKFVSPGVRPTVRITAQQTDGEVILRIADNGIGIKPEHQKRLFGMFERIHPETKYEGTGIGLAIVRKAVERMGGYVGVESDGVNGSTFWIRLPAA